MSRVALSSIKSLTFYKDSETTARRGSPIQQLTCRGKPCNLYEPDVVRCRNVGGEGTEVDWKCEADLPEALRFGRVEVSCEGWSKPGDPYVLKGSCGLEYRLVHVPSALRDSPTSWDYSKMAFLLLWTAALVFIAYHFFKSCLRRTDTGSSSRPTPRSRPAPSSGWFPGGHPPDDHTHDRYPPPPPYSPRKPETDSNNTASGWRPGFWTGLALGGVGGSVLNRQTRPSSTTWDWERDRFARPAPPQFSPPASSSSSSWFGARRNTTPPSGDRGEGSSRGGGSLGSMRQSTGLGGTNVR